MKLLVAIVQSVDADALIHGLAAQNIPATRIDSVGSFLAQGNVTVLMGLEAGQIEPALAVLAATCRTRRSYVNTMTPGLPDAPHISPGVLIPLEVEVGGAVVFNLPVERFVRLGTLAEPVQAATARQGESPMTSTADDRPAPAAGEAEAPRMKLVVAILQDDDADRVSTALLGGGYRLTRLKTTGGFFRRGNATLLIGVRGDHVDAVLDLVSANCRPARADAKPSQAAATVFVLDAEQFVTV